MGDWIETGKAAPAFRTADADGKTVTLEQFRGRPVVLYFYPKDDTPGCTKEACAFRDRSAEFARHRAVVLGVSPDDSTSHARFRAKYGLNFPLLADPDHAIAEAYGAWREKTLYGKKSIGIQRSTYLLDGDGIVREVWKKVSVDGHDEAVLAALAKLSRSQPA
jgi:thioredoxin-dependent peroxiredoxin